MVKNNINISICVPAFNEEESLRAAVEDLLTTLSPIVKELEVIIVNDGSTDSTLHLAKQLAMEYDEIGVIHHEENFGIGVCFRDALAIAKRDYFTWFPGDHENSAEEFIRCLPYLKEDTIVTCHHRGQDPRSLLRRLISQVYTQILNRYFHLDLKYYNGLTVFPRPALYSVSLRSNGFIFYAESLIKIIQNGYKIVELSTPLKKRFFGKSKALTFMSFYQMLKDIFKFII